MKVRDVISWLEQCDQETEFAVAVEFPQIDGWEVVSWALAPSEAEGSPAFRVAVYGADFDYPGPQLALEREARALIEECESQRAAGQLP